MTKNTMARTDFLMLAALLLVLPATWGCGGGGGGGTPPVPPPAPTASAIAPTGGPVAGGTLVTITGTGFTAGSAAVTVAGAPATGLTVVDDTTITCATPAGAIGAGAAVVVTTVGGAAPVPGGFNYVGFKATVAATNRVRIGDEFRFSIEAVDASGPASASLVNRLPGMQFDPSVTGLTPGSQQGRWVASRHAAGRHRLDFVVPGTALSFSFDIRVYGTSDYTGTGTLIGDVTGDGIQDVIAGASRADAAAVDSGLIYVFAGGAAPTSIPDAILFVPGAMPGDFLAGDAASGPGAPGSGQLLQIADVTGDGILDVVAGAPTADVSVVDDGAIYVWAGGAGLSGGAILAPDASLVVGFGVGGDMLCGTKDNSQGLIIEEVTGDGILDIIGVAPFFDSVAVDAGAIFIWPGGPALVGAGVVPAITGLAATGIAGGTAGSFLGRGALPGFSDQGQGVQVADVTGDGVNDIVALAKMDSVAAPLTGLALVFAGGAGILVPSPPTAELFDAASIGFDNLGHINSGGGLNLADVTGDGTLDVVLGTSLLDVTAVDEGGIFVWAGGAVLAGAPFPTAVCQNPLAVALDSMGDTETLSGGAIGGPRRGILVGDVTGDGTADIVACAPYADVAAPDSGAVFVFAGGAGLTGAAFPTAVCADPLATAGDAMGSNVRSGPSANLVDVTGDGTNDLVVPAPGADIGAVDDGAIFLFTGGAGLAGVVAPTATLAAPGTLGDAVGRVNHPALLGNGPALHFEDVTGDGIRDIVAASPLVDVLAVDDGAIYVWNGGAALAGPALPDSTLSMAGTLSLGAGDIFGFGGEGGVQILDVTGDGVLDITVNDPAGLHLGNGSAGVLYVWAGGAIPAAPPPTAALGGLAFGDGLGLGSGYTVVFGDVSQDGIDDIIVAGPDGFGGPPAGGHVFFWSGGAGVAGTPAPAVVMFDPLPPFSGSGIGSTFPYDFLNGQEMFVADLTGDGGMDILGADGLHSRAAVGANEGAIHLWVGPLLVPAPTVSFFDPLSLPGDQIGRVK